MPQSPGELIPKADAHGGQEAGPASVCTARARRSLIRTQVWEQRLKDIRQQLREKRKPEEVRFACENLGPSGQPQGAWPALDEDASGRLDV